MPRRGGHRGGTPIPRRRWRDMGWPRAPQRGKAAQDIQPVGFPENRPRTTIFARPEYSTMELILINRKSDCMA